MQPIVARSLPGTTKRSAGHERAQVHRALPTTAIGRVVGLGPRNSVLIDVPGTGGPAKARILKSVRREDLLDSDGAGREVLLAFDGASLDRPIIIGVLQSDEECETKIAAAATDGTGSRKERVLIEALAELVLKCGAGSITLRKDGKIVLRGTHLLSRASGPIRIKGGHVEIN